MNASEARSQGMHQYQLKSRNASDLGHYHAKNVSVATFSASGLFGTVLTFKRLSFSIVESNSTY